MKIIASILTSIFLVTGLFSFSGNEQQPDQYTIHGIAIGGYDAVAYFKMQKAVKGDSTIQLEWNGAAWYFSSRENLELFKANPEKYAPQYGGYCAYGASKGYKAKTDPEAWTIVGRKLYLNYNQNVKAAWLPDTTQRIQAANLYWESLKNK